MCSSAEAALFASWYSERLFLHRASRPLLHLDACRTRAGLGARAPLAGARSPRRSVSSLGENGERKKIYMSSGAPSSVCSQSPLLSPTRPCRRHTLALCVMKSLNSPPVKCLLSSAADTSQRVCAEQASVAAAAAAAAAQRLPASSGAHTSAAVAATAAAAARGGFCTPQCNVMHDMKNKIQIWI